MILYLISESLRGTKQSLALISWFFMQFAMTDRVFIQMSRSY